MGESASARRCSASFPTRRSSDLSMLPVGGCLQAENKRAVPGVLLADFLDLDQQLLFQARRREIQHHPRSEEHTSESSHQNTSYAVFSLAIKKHALERRDHYELTG